MIAVAPLPLFKENKMKKAEDYERLEDVLDKASTEWYNKDLNDDLGEEHEYLAQVVTKWINKRLNFDKVLRV